MPSYRLSLPFIVMLFFLIWGTTSSTQAQGNVDKIVITAVTPDEFPQIELQFRPVDRTGLPVTGLTINNVSLTENGTAIPVERVTELSEGSGVRIHFVVDAGASLTSGRWDNARAAIQAFTQSANRMITGLDQVAVTAVEASGRRTLINYSSDPNQINRALADYRPPGGTAFSAPLPVITDILEEMAILPSSEPLFVIFLSAGIELQRGSNELLTRAEELGIPIYTVLVRTDERALIEEIATRTGGIYTRYTGPNSMNASYTRIMAHRTLYSLSYRSTLSSSGTRQIALTIGSVTGNGLYSIVVNPPRVLISSPSDGRIITRQALEYTEALGDISPTTEAIVASVVFPDNHVRRLRRATLLVNGQKVNEITNISPTQNIELSWNLRAIQALGINDFTIQVEVEDELGIVSVSPDVLVKVELIVPPRPTPTSPPFVLPPNVQPNEDGEIVVVVPPIVCWGPEVTCPAERFLRQNGLALISLAIALASLLFAFIVYLNRDKPQVQKFRETMVNVYTRLTQRYRQAEPRAYLVVLDGDTNIGKSLEIFGNTTIGRSRQDAQLLFHQQDENSPISRRHCTLLDEEDHFMLRDEDSANGTYLNGTRLKGMEPAEIRDGDEIELSRVERGGVRLLFQVAQEQVAQDMDNTQLVRLSGNALNPAANPDGSDEVNSQVPTKPHTPHARPRF